MLDKKYRLIFKKRPFILGLKILFSLMIMLISGELILRILPNDITKIDFLIPEDYRLYSSTRHYVFKPNYSRVFSALGKPMTWYFNNYGFRDHSFPVNEIRGNIFRILFLGDSMVMGLGVDSNESLPKQLEKILSAKAGSKDRYIEVFNMGIVGYSPKQYQAVLEEVGLKLKPDLVVVGIFDNDPGEDIINFKDKAYHSLKALPNRLFSYPFSEYLEKNSLLFLFLVGKYYTFVNKFAQDTNPNSPDRSLYNQGWQITEDAMVQMSSLAKSSLTNIAFIGLPLITEVVSPEKATNERRDRFETIGKKHYLYYFDLAEKLKQSPDPKSLFIDGEDIHFSVAGNLAAAELIADYLIQKKLAPGSP